MELGKTPFFSRCPKKSPLDPMDRLNLNYVHAVRYLYDRINYEKNLDRPYDQRSYRLARMEYFLKELGNPHLAAPVIHVAGTKGKGSVSWLIAETLRRSGRRVGLYTSPHLMDLEERFVIDGVPCTPAELVSGIEKLKEAASATTNTSHGMPTFFEMTTALAWMLFSHRKTDVNVIEVGLGGRLDSTNVCQSSLAVITSISFDHQQQLGNTIELIATEKAGIIKEKVPVICGARHPDARQVVRSRCLGTHSDLWQIGVDFDSEITPLAIPLQKKSHSENTPASQLEFHSLNPTLPIKQLSNAAVRMPGKHQGDNSAVAIAVWNRLNADGWNLPEQPLRDAIAETQLCCRVEVVSSAPLTIVDTSHNVASIAALLDAIRDHFMPSKITFIFACSKDKEYETMLQQVLGVAHRLIVTQFQTNPRAVPVERLEELAKSYVEQHPGVEVLSAPSSEQAVEYATRSATENELICITGSFFLAAETRPLFNPQSHHHLERETKHDQ
jgi:dihydrofolate synthase/folylpolyglutamate synthase